MTKNTINNFLAAKAILNGETVVAHDRRTADAPKIEHSVKRLGALRTESGKPETHIMTAYGISNRTHEAIAKLASRVDMTERGRFVYVWL